MSVAGIICEYDPLHTGHAYLMAQAREAGAKAVVCAISGNFTQRGGFAVTDKLSRAEMAVSCGADLVLELPTVWAMSTAERFARGGVELLTRTGVVTELVFGSECGDLAALRRAADCLESPEFTASLASLPEDGRTFAARRQEALAALLKGSAALIAGIVLGWDGEKYLFNPTKAEREHNRMTTTIAATHKKIVMIESEADQVPENVMYEGIVQAHEHLQPVLDLIDKMVAEIGKPKFEYEHAAFDQELFDELVEKEFESMEHCMDTDDKNVREARVNEWITMVQEKYGEEHPDMMQYMDEILYKLQKKVVKKWLLAGKRVDGRQMNEIRPLAAEVGVIPVVHGSGLFTRGQTQVLSIATLATLSESQKLDTIWEEEEKRFMHHYNMPSYSTGEARASRSTGRREYGHGALVEKALEAVIPDVEDFPYAIRVVSEVLSSNGSTSQGSICGTTLALMDAGVPIKAPVAGISCGLIQDGDDFTTFIDIQGVEDFHGEMDFKVAGTKQGITAIQMDLKNDGLKHEIVKEAFEITKEARFQILDAIMLKAIAEPRKELAKSAPKMIQMKINPDKIREVIGSGGKVIQKITADTGCKIDINDDGSIFIASSDIEACRTARKTIEDIVFEPEVGALYYGKVSNIRSDFGAWVELVPGKDGLVKIKDLEFKRTEKVEDVLKVGDMTWVKVMNVGPKGIDLSRKDALKERGELK